MARMKSALGMEDCRTDYVLFMRITLYDSPLTRAINNEDLIFFLLFHFFFFLLLLEGRRCCSAWQNDSSLVCRVAE